MHSCKKNGTSALPFSSATHKKWYLVTNFQFSSSQKMTFGPFLKLLHNCTVKTKGLLHIITTALIFLSNLTSICFCIPEAHREHGSPSLECSWCSTVSVRRH